MATINKLVKFDKGYAISQSSDAILFVSAAKFASLGYNNLSGICIDNSGSIFLSDSHQHVILKVFPDGTVIRYAGTKGVAGNNGSSTVGTNSALFNSPRGIAIDASNNLYVADYGNNQIRMVTTGNRVSLVAGSPSGVAGDSIGVWTVARFNGPMDVALNPSGNLFVADSNNHKIRLINSGTSSVYTVAGTGVAGDTYGIGINSKLNTPYSVATDNSGNIYVFDAGNYKIKILNGRYDLLKFSGSGIKGNQIGTAETSQYENLKFSGVDRSGQIYVTDINGGTSRLLRIDPSGIPHLLSSVSGDDVFSAVDNDDSDILYVIQTTDIGSSSSSSSIDSSSSSSDLSDSSNSSSSSKMYSSDSSLSVSMSSGSSSSSSSKDSSSSSSNLYSESSSSSSNLYSVSSQSESSSSSSLQHSTSSSESDSSLSQITLTLDIELNSVNNFNSFSGTSVVELANDQTVYFTGANYANDAKSILIFVNPSNANVALCGSNGDAGPGHIKVGMTAIDDTTIEETFSWFPGLNAYITDNLFAPFTKELLYITLDVCEDII